MKRYLKVLLICLCLCPILLLTACGSPSYYKISAISSDHQLGYVQGALNEEMASGTRITLVAKETNANANPFICWVKDYKTVVSQSKSLSLSYSESTAGNYTAIFKENNPAQMMYAALSTLKFETEQFNTVSYEISITGGVAGSNSTIFATGTFDVNNEYKTDLKSVLFFGNASDIHEYRLLIKVKTTNGQGAETSYDIPTNPSINRESFKQQIEGSNPAQYEYSNKYSFTMDIPELFSKISLTFEKLSFEMYQSDKK